MEEIHTHVEVDAPADRVWRVLTDFDSYPRWNPFVPRIVGRPTVGSRLRVRIEPPESRGMTFRPRVTVAEPGRRLQWLGRLVVPGLFDGRHTFQLEPTDEGTRLVQRETFSGLLVGLLLDEEATREGFEAMNRALKARVETLDAEDVPPPERQ